MKAFVYCLLVLIVLLLVVRAFFVIEQWHGDRQPHDESAVGVSRDGDGPSADFGQAPVPGEGETVRILNMPDPSQTDVDLIVGVNVPQLFKSVKDGWDLEYCNVCRWGVTFQLSESLTGSSYGDIIQVGVFPDVETPARLLKDIIDSRSSLGKLDVDSPIGNERMIGERDFMFRRDNVLVAMFFAQGLPPDLALAKALDERLIGRMDGVRRGQRVDAPVVTSVELWDDGANRINGIHVLSDPALKGHASPVTKTGAFSNRRDLATAICIATDDCVMAAPFDIDDNNYVK